MKPRDKKLFILRRLSHESEPIALHELLEELDEDFKERSVRRWLNQLINEGLVKKIGQKRSTKYLVVRPGQNNQSASSCFSSESLRAIRYVKKPLFERTPKAYADDWFDAYRPNETFFFSDSVRTQLHEVGERATNNDPAGTYAHQIFNRLLIDLSYNSSRLEGNTYSKLDTERLLMKGKIAEGKLDEEKVMILNHKEAIRFLVENAPRLSVNEQTICTLHYLLSDGLVDTEYAGKLRDHWVRAAGSTYMPFDNIGRLEIQLRRVLGKAALINDPFEQSLFLLVNLSYLQAFTDVNKRLARLAANIPLIVGNLVPLSFNDIEKEDYISALVAVYELQDIHPISDLFAFSYMRTCAAYDSTVKAMGFNEVRVRYRNQRRVILREIIIQKMTGTQVDDFIKSETQKVIPSKDESAFMKELYQDIELIDESRIAGLGVTQEQLASWLRLYTRTKYKHSSEP